MATRTCLDAARRRGRRALPVDLGPASDHAVVDDAPLTDVAWLGPYPDAALADGPAAPDARYEQREAVELAFVAALQHLPGNQRAALLLFEVLGFSAAEIADMMDTSTASVNSALQRARAVVAEKIPPRTQQQTLRELDDARLREIVTGFSAALERGDADAPGRAAHRGRHLVDAAAAALVPRPARGHRLRGDGSAGLLRVVAAPARPAPTASLPWPATCGTRTQRRTWPGRSTC